MVTRTKSKSADMIATQVVTRQTLPMWMFQYGPQWSARITKYMSKEADLKKIKADPDFSHNPGPIFELGGFRLQELGSVGSINSGSLIRIVEVGEVEPSSDLIGELCEDSDGPLGDKASAQLRAKFDRVRFEFGEFSLVGPTPRLSGSKKRREQIRIINYLARSTAGTDKDLAKRLAQVLADNIENLEPSAEL